MSVVMQICSGDASPLERLLNFNFVEAVSCTYIDAAGLLVVGMIVYGAIGLSLYIRTGSMRIPAVLLLLIGGAIVPQIAGPAVSVAVIGIMLLGGGVITLMYYRYSR